MKNLSCLFICLFFIFNSCVAQSLFHEDFETVDSVFSGGNPGFFQSLAVQASGVASVLATYAIADSSLLVSNSFATLGYSKVVLSFNHICKMEFFDAARIYVSIDNGQNWILLTGTEYLGSSSSFNVGNKFSEVSYSDWLPGQGSVLPDNSWFKYEAFDISAMAANKNSVMVMFTATDRNGTGILSRAGWFIDDVKVFSPSMAFNYSSACNATGMATVVPYAGVAPYTYNWNTVPIQTNATATGLVPGYVACTITDINNNVFTDSVLIQNDLSVTAYILTIPTTQLSTNGAISVGATGGNSPYNFLWSNGATTNILTGLGIGIYTVTVTDSSGCVLVDSFDLNIPIPPIAFTHTTVAALCNSNTGSITVTPVNGVPPYNYVWNTVPVQTTATATGLQGNSLLIIQITDANGTMGTGIIYAPFVDSVNINLITATPDTCAAGLGTSTGFAFGGTPPYNYNWSTIPAQTNATATGLIAGLYILTVSDANGCAKSKSVYVPNITGFFGVLNSFGTCYGNTNGSMVAVISGGMPPYTYAWSTVPVQTNATATGLTNGVSYYVQVTDANGCSTVFGNYLSVTSQLFIVNNYSYNNCVDYSNTVSSQNGTAPFTFLWNTIPTQTNQTATGLQYNTFYNCKVTDANGCVGWTQSNQWPPPACRINIQGTIFSDENQNCIYDGNDFPLNNIALGLNGTYNTWGFSNQVGFYDFHVPNSFYQLHHYDNYFIPLCLTFPQNINVPNGSIVTIDIADTATKINDLSVSYCYSTNNVRGFATNLVVILKNEGTAPMSGTLYAKLDSNRLFFNALPLQTNYVSATKTVIWNFANILPFQSRSFSIFEMIDPTTPLGLPVKDLFYITSTTNDSNAGNDSCYSNGTVVGSYDPNLKQVSPPLYLQQNVDTVLSYTILFQNTGTDTARFINVYDTLDAALDTNYIFDVAASHAYILHRSGNVLRFEFPNIMLPDSFHNELKSHGHIHYKVRLKQGTLLNTQINNTAYIYFDFNSAIVTNTTVNLVVNNISMGEVENDRLHVSPNPTQGVINIVMNGNNNRSYALNITDLTGKILFEKTIEQNISKTIVDLSFLDNGCYIISLNNENGKVFSRNKVVLLK